MIDSHCHLDFDCFSPQQSLWQQANARGIQRLIIPGMEPQQWPKAYALAKTLTGVESACGLHPWAIQSFCQTLPSSSCEALSSCAKSQDLPALTNALHLLLDDFIAHHAVIAIGECGLDKHINTPIHWQEAVFNVHLQAACEHHLPLIVHNIGCHQALLAALKRFQPKQGGVIHGFSGSLELAQQYWRLGFYLGIGGVITYARAKKTQHCVKNMPIDALLLETDAPDMPPQGIAKGENSPLNLPLIAQALAELRGETLAHIIQRCDKNSQRLFNFHV